MPLPRRTIAPTARSESGAGDAGSVGPCSSVCVALTDAGAIDELVAVGSDVDVVVVGGVVSVCVAVGAGVDVGVGVGVAVGVCVAVGVSGLLV